MLINSLKKLSAGLAVVLLAGCSTVSLDEPQRLCAPGSANTSTGYCPELAPAPAPQAVAPESPPEAPVQTRPIQLGDAPPGSQSAAAAAPRQGGPTPGAPIRIALLLPLNSPSLGGAANAVRDGFMASLERDGAGFETDLISTGDATDETLDAYQRASASHDIVVGPLARPAVEALAASGMVSKPTVALNHPERRGALPPMMLVAGLSLEDEARQVAEWAAREYPRGRVLILTGNAAWAQRAASAFEARWSELGHTGQRFAVPSSNGRIDPYAISELKTRLEVDPPDLLFSALDVVELRQVRAQTGTAIPVYAGSSSNPGRGPAGMPDAVMPELNGLRVVDVPWLVQPEHGAVMVYPRPGDAAQPLYMQRLYALGIDAFLVARELALHPGAPVIIDGVTGRMAIDGARGARLQRREAAAIYRDGGFERAGTEP